MIYFASNDGRIKIGTTRGDIAERLKQIGAHLTTPVVLLGWIDGGHAFEHAIHLHLTEYRLQGEWFRDCEEVRRCVRNLLLGGSEAIGYEPPFESIPLAAQGVDQDSKVARRRTFFRVIADHAFPTATAEEIHRLTKRRYGERTIYEWLAGNSEAPAWVLIKLLDEILAPNGEEA